MGLRIMIDGHAPRAGFPHPMGAGRRDRTQVTPAVANGAAGPPGGWSPCDKKLHVSRADPFPNHSPQRAPQKALRFRRWPEHYWLGNRGSGLCFDRPLPNPFLAGGGASGPDLLRHHSGGGGASSAPSPLRERVINNAVAQRLQNSAYRIPHFLRLPRRVARGGRGFTVGCLYFVLGRDGRATRPAVASRTGTLTASGVVDNARR